MNTLRQFSEKERNYFAYQARQDFLRSSTRYDFVFLKKMRHLSVSRLRWLSFMRFQLNIIHYIGRGAADHIERTESIGWT
jgi:hypothetical protein